MSEQRVYDLSFEELLSQINDLYKKSRTPATHPNKINILLAVFNWRVSNKQNNANLKVSKNYVIVATIALIVSILMTIITLRDNRLDSERFEVLKEIRDNSQVFKAVIEEQNTKGEE